MTHERFVKGYLGDTRWAASVRWFGVLVEQFGVVARRLSNG
jgi:hypothetical protein